MGTTDHFFVKNFRGWYFVFMPTQNNIVLILKDKLFLMGTFVVVYLITKSLEKFHILSMTFRFVDYKYYMFI